MTLLNDSTILERVKTVSWQDTEIDSAQMIKLVELADWAAHTPSEELCNLEEAQDYAWIEALFPLGKLEEARSKFEKGARLAFRVPITIVPKVGDSKKSYFDIFLERDDSLTKGQDRYIRNGITIPDITGLYGKPVRGLLVVNDDPLSTFLGDAENPSHTTWEDRSSKILNDYYQGKSRLRFVKNGLKGIAGLLTKTSEGLDKELLKDVFYVDLQQSIGEGTVETPQNKKGKKSVTPEVGKLRGSQPFELTYVRGGFHISKKKTAMKSPKKGIVDVAYDSRKGNPFNNYDPRDFEMDRAPIRIEAKGATIHEKRQNRFEFTIIDEDFSVTVKGFDKNRDVKVRVVQSV